MHLTSCPVATLNLPSLLSAQIEQLAGEENTRAIRDKIATLEVSITTFDGTFNDSLRELISHAGPLPFSPDYLALLFLKGLWRVVYYNIWLPRCQDTIESERKLAISAKHKREFTALPSSRVLNATALKFGISYAQDQAAWKSTFTS